MQSFSLMAVFLFIQISVFAANPWMEGVVRQVIDGDTIIVQLDIDTSMYPSYVIPPSYFEDPDITEVLDKTKAIHLSQIDAPEMGQTYGVIAKKNLLQKVLHKKIRIIEQDAPGTAGLISAEIWYADENEKFINLNKILIDEGMAWVDRFSYTQEFKIAEQDAQKNKKGLWGTVNPTPPWMYREKRERIKYKILTNLNCAASAKICLQMANCREAIFRLQQCGRTDLDPDRDGTPCERTACVNKISVQANFDLENDD